MKSIIIIISFLFVSFFVVGQTYKVNPKTQKIEVVKKDSTTVNYKKHSVVNGIQFYISVNGKIFYFRTSKKTGNIYKCYIN
jgi:hypothetical protein